MLRVGAAVCVASSSPGLIDETTAGTLNNGGALAQNHLYMMTIEGRGVKATAATTKLLVRGAIPSPDIWKNRLCIEWHRRFFRRWRGMDKFPLIWAGNPVGELTVEREALYTWFTARCHLPEEGLWCAWSWGLKENFGWGF